jgi:hypothetical protein
MKFSITFDERKLQQQVQKAIDRKMRRVFLDGGPKLLESYSTVLRDIFASSKEFGELKGKFVGEFGFTPEEVGNLDNILSLLMPGDSKIVTAKVTARKSSTFSMILEWVDYDKLKDHAYAQHLLTKLDADGNVKSVTDIVSWVEWLEEGATVRGYTFTKPGGTYEGKDTTARSRSGQGLMRKDGGMWTFKPTAVLGEIAKGEDNKFLKKGFGILVERYCK